MPGLDDQLLGAKAGDTLTFDAELEALDQAVSFTVAVKDVKELSLPDADDEWAAEASEFATLEELRADIAERLAPAADRRGPDGTAVRRRSRHWSSW